MSKWYLNIRAAATAATLVLIAPFAALAVPAIYEIDFSNGGGTAIGTFQAPVGGGAVTNLMVTLDGVHFDTMDSATTNFVYDTGLNEFTWATATPSFTNSVAVAGVCAAFGCDLTLFPDPTPGIPGDYQAIDENFNNLGPGTKYEINPQPAAIVPIPAAVPLVVSGVGLLALVRSRRSRDAA